MRGSECDITAKLVIHHEQKSFATLTEQQNAILKKAKENDLDPYEYLKFIFTKAPNLKDNESIDILLPWNAPDDCRSKSACSTE